MPAPKIRIHFLSESGEELSRPVKAQHEEDGITVKELHKALDELFRRLPGEEWAGSEVVAGFRTVLGLSKNKAMRLPPKGFAKNGKEIVRLAAKFDIEGVEYRLEIENAYGHNLRMMKPGGGREAGQDS